MELITKRKQIVKILKTVKDPELNVDVWNLGLIYGIDIVDNAKEDSNKSPKEDSKNSNKVVIVMTFTSPSCPFAQTIIDMIKAQVTSLEFVDAVEVQITFEPLWSKDNLDLDTLLELGLV